MNTTLNAFLTKYRQVSKTEREKGTYFEHLALDFLKNNPVYAPQFEEVWTYSDWVNVVGNHHG